MLSLPFDEIYRNLFKSLRVKTDLPVSFSSPPSNHFRPYLQIYSRKIGNPINKKVTVSAIIETMLQKAINLFRRPYPADFSPSSYLIHGLFVGIFVFIFMIAFQPFGLYSLPELPRTLLYIGYGIMTFLAISLNNLLLPRLLPGFFRENGWNTGKNILFMTWITLIIGLGSYYVTLAICRSFELSTNWVRITPILKGTFFIGVIPVSAIILFESHRFQQRSDRIVSETNRRLGEHAGCPASKAAEEKIVLVAENNRDKFSAALAELMHIDAEENYVRVHFKKSQADQILLRSSLRRIERQIRPFYPRLFRCHRAHIVNIGRIRKVTGNAQGLRLSLEDVENPIPVSRRYVDEFRRVVVNHL